MSIETPFIRTPFNYDMDKESQLTGLMCLDESLAQDQFREDSDINTIVRNFGLTGQLPENPQPPVYADFDDIFDFQTAQNAVIAAQARFMAFPAHVRNRFNNDPNEMLLFVENDVNYDEAVKLGLVKTPTPQSVPSITPEPSKTSPST